MRILAAASAVLAVALLYVFPVRWWMRHWGAKPEDLARMMPGDGAVANPNYETTLAVHIDAVPERIWPWLVQMGYRRGGLYSYDWLDRLFGYLDAPSAERILPEFQTLRVGDEIPIGGGAPGFPVTRIDPLSVLVLSGEAEGFCWSWQLGLYPSSGGGTTLVSRNRARAARTSGTALFMVVLEPAAFIMTRKMLLNLKRRAESTSSIDALAGPPRAA